MKDRSQRNSPLEVFSMAKKLGLDLDKEQLRTALGERAHAHAVKSCRTCQHSDECHLFLSRESCAAGNQRWWAKMFCPNAELLIRLAKGRGELGREQA